MVAKPSIKLSSPKPYRLVFPIAAIFAAAYVPLWAMWPNVLPGRLSAPLWHGHEMLFGYGLLVVAGFLTTRPGTYGSNTWLLIAAWCVARSAPFLDNLSLAAAAGLGFPIVVFAAAAIPLLRGSRRRENLIAPGVLAIFAITELLWWVGAVGAGPSVQHRALLSAIDAFALLLMIFAGRALPAAVGGYLGRRGMPRRDRIRRGYELPTAALMAVALAGDLLGYAPVAGACSLAAAFIAAWRARAWQLAQSLTRPDLWALALGYLWLVPGLLLKGVAQLTGILSVTLALHGITMGALGTLTVVMMARTAAARSHRRIEGFADIGVAASLLAVATLSRLLVSTWPWLLQIAAVAWSAAFVLVLARLIRTKRPAPQTKTRGR